MTNAPSRGAHEGSEPARPSSTRASGARRRTAPWGDAQRPELHARCVDERVFRGGSLSDEATLDAFDRALRALWHRAATTLGEGTLVAVVTRVVHRARMRHPGLQGLTVTAAGVRHDRAADAMEPAESRAALRFVLVELLRLLDEMTAQVLTPALHDELARVRDEARLRGAGR